MTCRLETAAISAEQLLLSIDQPRLRMPILPTAALVLGNLSLIVSSTDIMMRLQVR